MFIEALNRETFESFSDSDLKLYFPELHALKAVPQDPKWHPEGDAFEHTMCVLDQINILAPDNIFLQFCALTHDLGKALTPKEKWPHQYGHAFLGIAPTKTLIRRLLIHSRLDVEYISAANKVAFITEYHMHVHQAQNMKASTYFNIILKAYEVDSFNPYILLNHLCVLGAADHFGRGKVEAPALNSALMQYIFSKQTNIDFTDSKKSIANIAVDINAGKIILGLKKD